jgi:hypothetical protein
MKRLILLLLGLILFSNLVLGLDAPKDTNTAVQSQIVQEHKNTRKFFSDELERQKKDMFDKWDDRADYYERTFDDMITNTVWKLALMWSGIMIMFVSFSAFLKTRMENRKYDKLKKNIKEELVKELTGNLPKQETKKEKPKEKYIYDNKFEVEL